MNYSDLDILFLTTKEIPDYLQDAVFMGLTELGCNVVDCPRRKSLHGSWHSPDYRVEQLLFHYPEQELRKDPDLLIVTGMYGNYNYCKTFEGWTNFVHEIIKKYKPGKIVMLDGEDAREFHYPDVGKPYDAVFKREPFLEGVPRPHYGDVQSLVYDVKFSAVPESFQYVYFSYRKYDISFIATLSNPYRLEIKNYVEKKAAELGLSVFLHVDRSPLSRQDYLNILSYSKTAVSVRGAGFDCYRYWELPAKGVVMVADDPGMYIENDFDSNHIFKFKNIKDLEEILVKIKKMPIEALEEMSTKALWHTIRYHTPRKRAKYILEKIYGENNVS